MARIRSVKPEFFQDQDIAVEVPNRDARLLYIGLWTLADEHGRLRADPAWIKGQVYAYDDDITPEVVTNLIDMLVASGRAVRYRVRSSDYLFLPKLDEHQRLEPEKVPSRLPEPPCELGEHDKISSSENGADISAPRANQSALKQAAGSRVHVAGSMGKVPDESAPRRVPAGADDAARLVAEATGAPPDLAAEAVMAIARERKPRNLPGLTRTIIDRGEIEQWLTKARKALDAEAVANAKAIAREGPPCAHGLPGGDQRHPLSQKPWCALCRRKAPR